MKVYKNITVPYICPINNKKFDSIKGLSIYVTKILKMRHKIYYDEIAKGDKIKCHFCNNDGRFVSMTKGYANLCHNNMCISKSRSTYSIEGIMYNKGCSKDEAIKIFEKLKNNNINKNIQISIEATKNNPNYVKENSSWCIEFWLKKGLSKKDAEIKLKQHQTNNGNLLANKLKNDSVFKNNWIKNINVSLEYWLNKGYTTEDAIQKLKERQTTFSKDKCIKKYGHELGLIIWQERQDKWQNTIKCKTDIELIKLNKSKSFTKEQYINKYGQDKWNDYVKYYKFNKVNYIQKYGIDKWNEHVILMREASTKNKKFIKYSKIATKLFDELKTKLNTECFYNNSEKLIFIDEYKVNKNKFYYFVDFMSNNKIIEFYGDYWHANPIRFNENSIIKSVKTGYITAKDIWKRDYDRIKRLNSAGYEVLVIWEYDFKHNNTNTIQKCIDFINNKQKV